MAGMGSIGKMDQRITLQSFSSVSDGGGGFTKAWADLPSAPTVWADARPATGREQYTEGRDVATAMTVFLIRNRSDVNEECRVVWGGENYNIRDIKRAGGREMYLEIVAERGVSN